MAINKMQSLDLSGLITTEGSVILTLPSVRVASLKKGNIVGYNASGGVEILKEGNKATIKGFAVCLEPDSLTFLVQGVIKSKFLVEAPTVPQGVYGNVLVLK